MHLASTCIAAGADFRLHSARRTMLRSTRPVIAVTAVRTGVGKSQTTRYLSGLLRDQGLRVVAIRHPMPYGDLAAQACQRFATYADLDRYDCTIEEREEYEPHIDNGVVVYAGVDYERILRAAEQEADVVLWDGGNNDLPFYVPDLHIVLADPLRPGDEAAYHPGEANVRMADVVVIAKCDSARSVDVEAVEASVRDLNPRAAILRAESPVTVDDPSAVRRRQVIVVEDGPTLTHGSMTYGAGVVGARAAGAADIVDPVPYAVGSIAATYAKYPNARGILPAMGYGAEQVADLEATIRGAVEAGACDAVVAGTPIDLTRVLTAARAAGAGALRAARESCRADWRLRSAQRYPPTWKPLWKRVCDDHHERTPTISPPGRGSLEARSRAPASVDRGWPAQRLRRLLRRQPGHAVARQRLARMGGRALPHHGRGPGRRRRQRRDHRPGCWPTSSTSSSTGLACAPSGTSCPSPSASSPWCGGGRSSRSTSPAPRGSWWPGCCSPSASSAAWSASSTLACASSPDASQGPGGHHDNDFGTSHAPHPAQRHLAALIIGCLLILPGLGMLLAGADVAADYYCFNGGLGTDRYPPFSLGEEPDYAARLDIAYPERLSRGLVLVKSWLLAIPHYIILGLLVGGGG